MRRCRPLLGTYVDIAVLDTADDMADDTAVAEAIGAAFDAVAKVERLMSFHDAGSELSAVNAAPGGAVLRVDAWTADVLRLAKDLFVATAGAFDCGVGDVLVAHGDLPAHPARVRARAHDRDRAAPARPGSLRDIDVRDDHRIVVHRTVCLDLGGIAKGFAVDKAVQVLADRGVSKAVVNAGGDLRVLGDDPQPIHVRSGGASPTLRFLGSISGAAVATSTTGAMPGRCRGGLVDPFTRHRLRRAGSFTVLAPTCAVADGLTKALAVAGALDAACLRRYGAIPVVA